MVPLYGMYGARLQEVWCPFTVCMVPLYGKLWCPFTVSNRMVPVYGKLRCPLTGSMVPIYGMYGAGVKVEREKTALGDTQSRTCEVRGGITDEANRLLGHY
jgi:hypothetical protein